MQQEKAKRMVQISVGNEKNMVENLIHGVAAEPREVIIVRPILQWVDFEHSTRYFGRIGGVCETHDCLEPGDETCSESSTFPGAGAQPWVWI